MDESLTVAQIYDEVTNLDLLNIRVPVTRKGKDLILTPEILALFKPDSAGRLHPIVDASGRVTEASASDALAKLTTIDSDTGAISSSNAWINDALRNMRDNSTPGGGNLPGASPYSDRAPVVILADGAGMIGAAVPVDAAVAGKDNASEWTIHVDTTGNYLFDFIENTGAPAIPVPDYTTVPVSVPLIAGAAYKVFIQNTTNNTDLGVNSMPNGSFPNNATMVIISKNRSF